MTAAPGFVVEDETPVAVEIEAMSAMVATLEPLDVEARNRVLRWATSRYRTDEAAEQAARRTTG